MENQIISLPKSLTVRLITEIAGAQFEADVEGSFTDMRSKVDAVTLSLPDHEVVLTKAQLILESYSATQKNYLHLDESSESLLCQVLKNLNVGAEHNFNETLGSYDPLVNRVTPADMGIQIPDGTLRFVWDLDESKYDLDTSFDIVTKVVELLLTMQTIPYFNDTEDEINSGVYRAADRRIDVLHEAGLWPNSDSTLDYELATQQHLEHLVKAYAQKTPAFDTEQEPETA